MNRVIIMGRIGKDIEIKSTPNGIEVSNFSVAVNRPTGKGKEKVTDWIPCTAFGTSAAFVSKYFRKGDMIAIEGSLQSRQYEDSEGKKRTAYTVRIDHAEFCGSKSDKTADNGYSSHPVENSEMEEISPDDVLPF